MPENDVWRRNKDAGKQDLGTGSVPESDGYRKVCVCVLVSARVSE